MAKFTVLVAIFIATLFVVDASIYRATVIFDDVDENTDENQSMRRCSHQIQQQQNLRQCKEYIRQRVRGYRGRGRGLPPADETENQSDQFRRCCSQLQQLDSMCRCEGLKIAFQQLQGQGMLRGQDIRQAYFLAQNLPKQCRVSPRQCLIRWSWGLWRNS